MNTKNYSIFRFILLSLSLFIYADSNAKQKGSQAPPTKKISINIQDHTTYVSGTCLYNWQATITPVNLTGSDGQTTAITQSFNENRPTQAGFCDYFISLPNNFASGKWNIKVTGQTPAGAALLNATCDVDLTSSGRHVIFTIGKSDCTYGGVSAISRPPPRNVCSSTKKCCGAVGYLGSCDGQCVPNNAHCP